MKTMKNKKVKKEQKILEWNLVFSSTLIIGLFYSTLQFMVAYHNVDLVYNAQSITSQINILLVPYNLTMPGLTDTGSDYVNHPIGDYYISSMNQLKKYFIISAVLSLLIGIQLNSKKEDKYE